MTTCARCTRPADIRALRAIELVAGAEVYESPFQDWPEIAHAGDLIEIRDVDLRGVKG